MQIPDFYVIGGSKCGTTALSEYISEHPNVCFARTKEPHYFSDDFPDQKMDDNFDQYWKRNFSYFDPNKHLAIGEGSGTYYLSKVAIENILKANPNAKFIYMVRNPIEVVHSWFYDQKYSQSDDVEIEVAWGLQAIRAQGKRIPRFCPDPWILQYRMVASLGSRLEALNKVIPKNQLMVVVFDDFVSDTKAVYEDVLKFIGVPSDSRSLFPVINSSKVQRSKLIGMLSASIPRSLYNIVRDFKGLFGLNHAHLNFIARMNTKYVKKMPLADEFKELLILDFEREFILLEQQLNRSFESWRR